MKRWVIAAAAALVCACTPPAGESGDPPAGAPTADAAGNRMEALVEQDGRWCSGDGVWCLVRNASDVRIVHNGAETQLLGFTEDTGTPEIWPMIVRNGRNDDSVVFGLKWSESEMYSGGGANVTKLALYRFEPGAPNATEVGTFPSSARINIRACFDEDDRVRRRDACSDDYTFGGALSLDEGNTSGPARLILQTTATTYPGARSRSSDSSEEPPLDTDDLVTAPDATCSYRRVLTYDGEAYWYDNPPPACEDYQLQ